MTIASTPSEVEYAGDGVSVSFPIPFVFDTSADLKVIRTDPAGTPAVLSSGFSITGGGGGMGTLTLATALASGYTLTILDDPELTQPADYIDNDAFPAAVHEGALDRTVRQVKRLYQLIQNSVRFADGDPATGSPAELGSVDARKGKYLFFNAVTGAIEYAVALAVTTLTQSIIGALLYPQSSSEASAGVTIVNGHLPYGRVDRYGTNATPGTTDMRAAIQAAFNSGHEVTFEADQTYAVSASGSTVNVNGNAYPYATLARAGMRVKGNGATIALLNAQNATIVMLYQVDDVVITDLVLDFNRANQTTPASGEMANILAYDCDGGEISKIQAVNVRQYAGRFLNLRRMRLVGLDCSDSHGDGWSLGTTGSAEFRLFSCFIDDIYAEDCEGAFAGLEGNGVILTAVDTKVGTLHTKDCAGGIKLQNSTTRTRVAVAIFDGDDHTFAGVNSGLKLQGFTAGGLFPTDLTVDSAISRNGYGNGLVITAVNSVSLGTYHGYNNGSGTAAAGSDQNDVEINTTDGTGPKSVQIGSIEVDEPDATGVRHQGSGNVDIGSVVVRNSTGPAVQDLSSGRVKIGHINAIWDHEFTSGGTYQILVGDTITGATSGATAVVTAVELQSGTWAGGDAAGRLSFRVMTGIWAAENLNVGANLNVATIIAPTMTYAFQATGTAKGRVDSVETNLGHATAQSRVLIQDATNFDLEIGRIRLGSADNADPVVQLTNASATTALTNGHIWRTFVGGSVYFHPLIRVQPWDASARALSGQFGIVVADGSSGTGGTVQHPSAGANDFVGVFVEKWKNVAQAQA